MEFQLEPFTPQPRRRNAKFPWDEARVFWLITKLEDFWDYSTNEMRENVVRELTDKFNAEFKTDATTKQIKSRVTEMKRVYKAFCELSAKSGRSWEGNEVALSPEEWEDAKNNMHYKSALKYFSARNSDGMIYVSFVYLPQMEKIGTEIRRKTYEQHLVRAMPGAGESERTGTEELSSSERAPLNPRTSVSPRVISVVQQRTPVYPQRITIRQYNPLSEPRGLVSRTLQPRGEQNQTRPGQTRPAGSSPPDLRRSNSNDSRNLQNPNDLNFPPNPSSTTTLVNDVDTRLSSQNPNALDPPPNVSPTTPSVDTRSSAHNPNDSHPPPNVPNISSIVSLVNEVGTRVTEPLSTMMATLTRSLDVLNDRMKTSAALEMKNTLNGMDFYKTLAQSEKISLTTWLTDCEKRRRLFLLQDNDNQETFLNESREEWIKYSSG